MRLLASLALALCVVGACTTQDSGGGGGGSGGSGGAAGGGGAAFCSGSPICPPAGCTFAAAVANCAAEYAINDFVSYSTAPCGGFDILYEAGNVDSDDTYYFDHATGKLVATIGGADADAILTCIGPSDFVVPAGCEKIQDLDLTMCPKPGGSGGAGGASNTGGSSPGTGGSGGV